MTFFSDKVSQNVLLITLVITTVVCGYCAAFYYYLMFFAKDNPFLPLTSYMLVVMMWGISGRPVIGLVLYEWGKKV